MTKGDQVKLKTPVNAGDKWIPAGTICEVERATDLFLDVKANDRVFWIHKLEADKI